MEDSRVSSAASPRMGRWTLALPATLTSTRRLWMDKLVWDLDCKALPNHCRPPVQVQPPHILAAQRIYHCCAPALRWVHELIEIIEL